jgi:predicted nucleic acid-binding protein
MAQTEVMMSTLYRAQILLESDQHEALAEIAQQEGRSISDLVREIVRQHLNERDKKARKQREMQALEHLTQIRARLKEEHGIYEGDLLAEVKAEQEGAELWTADKRLANGARQAGVSWVHWIGQDEVLESST